MEKCAPIRQCIACRRKADKRELLRVVNSEGALTVDETGRAQGRGAYICASEDCLLRAKKIRAFERSVGAGADDAFIAAAMARIEVLAKKPEDSK